MWKLMKNLKKSIKSVIKNKRMKNFSSITHKNKNQRVEANKNRSLIKRWHP